MKLGIVTYQIAKDWDVPTLIDMCHTTGIQGVELRTTHAHGVEIALSSAERSAVRRRFEDAEVDIVGLGSIYEYHDADPETVRRNIDGTVEYARLAADLGCSGVKVRPNALQTEKGIPEEETLVQIGRALGECGEATVDLGVQIRVEVHGRGTCEPRRMRTIIDHAGHDNVYICWNCNPQDVVDGSVRSGLRLAETQNRARAHQRIAQSRIPLAGTLRAPESRRIRRIHPGRNPRQPGAGTALALLQSPVAGAYGLVSCPKNSSPFFRRFIPSRGAAPAAFPRTLRYRPGIRKLQTSDLWV